jgi:predicted dehydrogenase
MGPNLVRNFAQAKNAKIAAICDFSASKREQAQSLYPAVKICSDLRDIMDDPGIDAVVIATPVSTHFDLGMAAMRAGKHVLVEKPLAMNSIQGLEMVEFAEQQRLVLMVGHTFVYTSAVAKIKELVDKGDLGQLYYYDSVRVNLGLFQSDVNVLWDLAVHDLSIMDYVIGQKPVAVAASGIANVPGQPESLAYLTCFFPNELIAHFHVNWLAPVKIRRTLIGGSNKMIVYDDMELSEKVKLYDKGVMLNRGPEDLYQLKVGYRAGDMWAPHIGNVEALRVETQHFIDCIIDGQRPRSDGQAGLRLVRILEAASASLKTRGAPIELSMEA